MSQVNYKFECARIQANSVRFWEGNREACRWENYLGRIKAEKRKKYKIEKELSKNGK